MNRTNTVLAVLLVVVVVMTAGVGVDYSQPNIEILPDMKYTPAWEAFAANPNFANGRTMQPPVAGTIARGQMPLYFAATKEDAVRAGEELTNPHSLTAIQAAVTAEREQEPHGSRSRQDFGDTSASPELLASSATSAEAIARERFAASVERGGDVYRTFCISCHGPRGAGDGPVPQRGFPPPPSMLTGKSLQMKDGQLFHILTYGQGSMAPFTAQLSRDLRWDVINYVRDLQRSVPAIPDAEPAAAEATPATSANKTDSQTKAAGEKALESPPTGAVPDAQSQPAVVPAKEPANKSTETIKEEKPKAPPNELRKSAAGDEKKPAGPAPQVPGDEPQSTTSDAES
ncbi:MAG: c-type cytochrome [Planctomycetia bacterium]|nr:c-type cytochrome [Planctomycetia bacterium]